MSSKKSKLPEKTTSNILSFFGNPSNSTVNKPNSTNVAQSSNQQKNGPKSKSESTNSTKATIPRPLPKPKSQFEYIDKNKSQHTDSPPHLGEIEVPDGAPGCLNGIVFTASGTLNSITRKQIKEIIMKYGGKLIGKVLPADIFIRGVKDVSREKLEEARDNDKTIIDEDGFFYILKKSLNPDFEEKKPAQVLPPQEENQRPIAPISKPKIDPPAFSIPDSCPSPFSSQETGPQYPDSQPVTNSNMINAQERPISTLFTEKYRPKLFSDLVGNKEGISKLRNFLKNFDKQEKKSVIIFGPPGIGKTTSAVITAKAEGYHVIEFNASDTRNKKKVEEIAKDIFTNQTLFKYRNAISRNLRSCIIFDEVDGMSSGDRGGVQALTDFIKKSRIPIICICNDGFNKKLQTLKKYSIEIPFSPPTAVDMAKRLDVICKAENIKMNRMKYIAITNKAAGDIRSALNSLQLWSSGVEDSSEKDTQMNDVFQAVVTLFKPKTEFEKRMDCFFVDYDMMPSYVHHYCTINEKSRDKNRLKTWNEALDSMAYGNEMENVIRGENAWDLLNPLGIVSTVIPATLCPKFNNINRAFPEDFLRASKLNSNKQNLMDISMRCRRNCGTATTNAFRDSTADLIVMKLNNLIQQNNDYEAMEMLDQLEITKDDLQNLQNITGGFTGYAGADNTPKFNEKTNKSFVDLYKKNHPETKKSYKNIEDERSDYYIKNFTKRSKKK